MAPQDKPSVQDHADKDLVDRVKQSNRIFELKRNLGPELVDQIHRIYREESETHRVSAHYGALLGSGLGALVGCGGKELQYRKEMTRRDFGDYVVMTLMGAAGGFIFGGLIGDGVGEGQARDTLRQKMFALMEQHHDKKALLQEYLHLAYPRLHFSTL